MLEILKWQPAAETGRTKTAFEEAYKDFTCRESDVSDQTNA